MKKSNAKIRIVPIFIVIAILLAITISSEVDKQIDIKLEFYNLSDYDTDNDGIETTEGVVDLSVENTEFNWDIDESKLLTKWNIINENDLTTSVCYGNYEGCAFIDLVSSSEEWDDILYMNYGKDGAGYNNIVSGQVIYYDVSSSQAEIYNSEESEKEVEFYEDVSDSLSNLNVVIKDKSGKSIGHYSIAESDNGYDLVISNKKSANIPSRILSRSSTSLSFDDSLDNKDGKSESKVEIRKIKNVRDIETVIDEPSDEEITTDIVAVNDNGLEFENAEITLAKNGDVNVIMRCADFDFDNSVCEEWQATNIEFEDYGDYIKFEVEGFSAYGGSNITILNVYSYPALYGKWTAMFNSK